MLRERRLISPDDEVFLDKFYLEFAELRSTTRGRHTDSSLAERSYDRSWRAVSTEANSVRFTAGA